MVGHNGVVLLPIIVLSDYIKHCGWKSHKKGRSYYVRIKLRDGKYVLFCPEFQDIDVSEYFIPIPEE